MKREIKFRGRGLNDGEWKYGDLISPKSDPAIVSGYNVEGVAPDTIGQYTGLKDRNGKEIYEGDIVRRKGEPDYVAEVIYDNGEFIGCGHYRLNGQIGWMLKQGFQLEVIGNIHDNPELLKE